MQIKKLEQKIAEMHGRKHCIFVSRGMVAIYLALKALGFNHGKVVLPSILCLSLANAVIYAGLEPIYCDINLNDFNIDPKGLEKILKKEKDVRAIILPHAYGRPTDIDRILKLAKKYKITLIEDAAQSLGGKYNDQPLGSFGGFSILSFGHTKILDIGGGGALLFDDDKYVKKIRAEIKKLPAKSGNYCSLQEQYLKAYYSLAPLTRGGNRLNGIYSLFPHIFKELYLFGDIERGIVEKVAKGLKRLRMIVDKRNENAKYYNSYLQHEKIIHPKNNDQGVCWRYSFLVKGENQIRIAEAIREKKVHVSNWYPPLNRLYNLAPAKLKNADYLGSHIFNLWVDLDYSKRDIKRISDIVMKAIDKNG